MVTDSFSTQPAGLISFDQIKAVMNAHEPSWPLSQVPDEPPDIQEMEERINSIWYEIDNNLVAEADRQGKVDELAVLQAKLQPLVADYERTCRGLRVAYTQELKMKANSLINNLYNVFENSGLFIDGDMIVDASAVDLTTDSPDADPDTPRRSRMKLKRGGALLTPNRNGVFEPETRKRKRAPNPHIAQKRPRVEGTRNSIHFNAVYQNKRAARKHIIIRVPEDIARPGKFFILRCEQHDLHFDDSPLQAGLAHLVEKHKHQDASFDAVVENFGYEVIGCDDEKLTLNNKIAKEAFEKGDNRARDSIRVRSSPSPERPTKGANREARKGKSTRSRRKRGDTINPSDLIPGNVYIIYWAASKQWFAGMLLPLQDLESVGIDETVEKMGLLNNIPPCYQYDSSSQSFSWAEGYEDGGPNSLEQHFAFMFFEGVAFPDESHVAWIPIDDIQKWDENQAMMIEHSEQAFEYLKKQKSNQQPKRLGSDDEIPDSTDDNSTSDLAAQSPVAESSTDLQPPQDTETATPNTAQEADTTEQAEEVPKDTEMEPEKAVQTNEQPDVTEDEDVVMDSQENITESVPQRPSEDGADIIMETPEDTTEKPSPQDSPKSDGGDQEMILDTQEDPAENVSPPKQPEEANAEREKPALPQELGADRLSSAQNVSSPKLPEQTNAESENSDSPSEQGGDRLSSADLQNLLDEGVDLEFHLSQSEQREIVDSPTPSIAPETTSLAQAAHNFVNETREHSQPLQNPVARETSQPLQNPVATESGPSKPNSIVTESSRDETPQPRLSYADMGRAASFSESSSGDMVDLRPQIQPASKRARSGTPSLNLRASRSRMSSASQSPVASRPPMSPPATIPLSSTAAPASVSIQSSVTLRPLAPSQPSVPRSPILQRPLVASQQPVSSLPSDRSRVSTTPQASGASQSSILPRRPALLSQTVATSHPLSSSQSSPAQSPTSSRPPLSSQPSVLSSQPVATSRPPLLAPRPALDPELHSSTAQVATPHGPAVSNSEQPNNIRPTSQTSQVLAPPRPPSVETTPPVTAQPRSKVLRHPHAVEAKEPSMSPVKSPQHSKETHAANLKTSAKSSVAIILLNGGSVGQARPKSTAPGQNAADQSLPQRPAVHQRHSEPVPISPRPPVTTAYKPASPAPRRPLPQGRPSPRLPTSPAKSLGAPQAIASQPRVSSSSQPASTVQQTLAAQPSPRLPSMDTPQSRPIAEKTPATQPRPAQQLPSHQPPVRNASRPASPTPRPSPRLPPMEIPRSTSLSQRQFVPHTLVSQSKSPSPVPVPRPRSVPRESSATQAPEHRPSPRMPAMEVPRSASPSQGHYLPHTMLAQKQAALSNLPGSAIQGDSKSQPMTSPRQPATECQQSRSAFQGQAASPLMPSPRQAAMSISRPGSASRGPVASQQMQSPRPTPLEVPRSSTAYQGHPAQYPVPSPRGPYAVPVAPPLGSPHQSVRHLLSQGHGIYVQRSLPQQHWAPTGALSPRLPSMETKLPPMRLPDISHPRAGSHTTPNEMVSPRQSTMGSPPMHHTTYQQHAPQFMQSPRQSAAEIHRPHTAVNMRPLPSAMSPMLGYAEPPRPNSSYAQNVPFNAPLPTMIPAHSNPNYQSSAPSAHRYAQPNPPQGHSRRRSESAALHQTQQYALGGSPQIANSTPRSHQPHELDPNMRCYLAPFFPELSPNIRRAIQKKVGKNQQDFFPGDFLNSENRYKCPFCVTATQEPREFIDHLKMGCEFLEEVYREDRDEKVKEVNKASRGKQTKRKSQAPQANKNARVRC
ncbi:hypothetical protein IL306_010446 [Fusarium sp. DS 682]|nr:hypothetical protein IL306_010446 [Fusarium sp. DS 682]